MKRLARDAGKFEAVDLFTAVARDKKFEIGNSEDLNSFISGIRESLENSHATPRLLYGKRVEALFAQVAGALGECKFIKSEDAGEMFSDDDGLQAPDYRLILKDGRTFLVEVKNFHSDPFKVPFVLRKPYFLKLEKYAEMHGVQLKIAVFFSQINRWCLLSKRAFKEKGKSFEIGFAHALAKSEMGELLGDKSYGTLPELKIELFTDERHVQTTNDDGKTAIVFGRVKAYCAGAEIHDAHEQDIAFYFMRFGEWEHHDEQCVENGRLLSWAFSCRPRDRCEGQEFEIIGCQSTMISAAFAEHTLHKGLTIALDAPVDPANFQFNISKDYNGKDLPLWQFTMVPNYEKFDHVLQP